MKKSIMSKYTLLLCLIFIHHLSFSKEKLNLNHSEVEIVGEGKLLKKSFEVLREEVNKRTDITLQVSSEHLSRRIVIGVEDQIISRYPETNELLATLTKTGKDGFKLVYDKSNNTIFIAGHDERGTFYGVGFLLRKLEMTKGNIFFVYEQNVSSTPVLELRGVGLGPNYKNAKGGEDPIVLQHFEQYIRELFIFGANSIDLTRGKSPKLTEIAKSYGFDIGIVSFDNGPDFKTEEGVKNELALREKIFKTQPSIDHWTIKSGDPGNLDVETFMSFTKQEVKLLRKYHPNAKVWVAPQKFIRAPISYFEDFIYQINNSSWIDGVVYGPWARMTMEEFRSKIVKKKSIRHFADISHIYSCQYPVEQLDLPMAISYGRIAINPRPLAKKNIHNLFAGLTVGSLTYSEGSNDDVNKFIWLGQDWNPNSDVKETVQDYSRFFIGPDFTEDFTDGLYLQEQSMIGKVEQNKSIDKSFDLWKSMEVRSYQGKLVYDIDRFRMGLIRAYFDKYIKERLLFESWQEKKALEILESSTDNLVIKNVRNVLNKPHQESEYLKIRSKCKELYNLVYKGESGSWTTEYQECMLYKQMDVPLNNKLWINYKLDQWSAEDDLNQKGLIIKEILNRTHLKNDELYFNLGSLNTDYITKTAVNWNTDPYFLKTPYLAYGAKVDRFTISAKDFELNPIPIEWLDQVGIYYDQPLHLTFSGLDDNTDYKIKVVYIGEMNGFRTHVKLLANERYKIHDFIRLGDEKYIYEFDLPKTNVSNGQVNLAWQSATGERGVTIAEISFKPILN